MHRAIIKTKRGYEPVYYTYSRHSDELNVTVFFTGECGQETTYVRDENIIEITLDQSVKTIMDD